MRKTKIICTMGPACQDEKTLTELCLAGMNVARLNFSHGTHESHQIVIDRIKKIRKEHSLPIAMMLDTKGPEIRTCPTLSPLPVKFNDIIHRFCCCNIEYCNFCQQVLKSSVIIDGGITKISALSTVFEKTN